MEQKVKIKINPSQYFGVFAMPDQEYEIEGHAFLVRDSFLETKDTIMFVAMEDGHVLPINTNYCQVEFVEDDK